MSGKYAFNTAVKELRFLFCNASDKGAATRTFLNRAYPTMKKNNPNTPILIREALGTSSHLGVEKTQSLEGLSDKQIEDAVVGLVKAA
ncbi:NADH-ubiquinone oxidoreductase 10.5 kDa subunit [Ceratocystis lukuohia]|uniref:NADH-ubiquinone oxidoreductase 10.5 kDa subunit n=1 Tax=Ceratocystis lukuohia TaxID=2019550 RepID=A0ABR4M9H0_9PEZI